MAMSGDATISNTGALTIAANSVALSTDTTGDYVLNLTASNGLQATTAAGEGTTPNLVLGGTLSDDTTLNTTNTRIFKIQDLVGTDFLTFTGATGITLAIKLAATTADIDGGTLDNVSIGATTRNSAAVTSLSATAAFIATASIDNADINGGTIDNVTIGTTARAAGSFTTISGTSAAIAGTVSAGLLLTSNILGGTTTTSGLILQTTSNTGTTTADIHFLVGSNGGTEAMTILNNGNVGIGIATPSAKLEVNGSIKFGGKIFSQITYCSKTSTVAGIATTVNANPNWCYHYWTTGDCDNGLPTGTCIGFLRRGLHAGSDQDWDVLLPGEAPFNSGMGASTNGGMNWWNTSGCSTVSYAIGAVYFCN
ncbi:MAG: hypothetical protein U0T83_08300 [Bacteriovoracaceae bacterium]